jgi:cell division protein FtsA
MDMMKMIGHELETDMPISVVPAGVVLTGNGALLEGIKEVAEQALGMNARVGRPRYSGPHADLVSEPGYSAALGLLAHAARLRSISGTRRQDASASSAVFRSVAVFFRGLFNK